MGQGRCLGGDGYEAIGMEPPEIVGGPPFVARRGGGPDGGAGEPALWSAGRPEGLPTRPAIVRAWVCRANARSVVSPEHPDQVARPGCRWCGSATDYTRRLCTQCDQVIPEYLLGAVPPKSHLQYPPANRRHLGSNQSLCRHI